IQSMKKAGTINPVMMLDEIDKLGADFRGDPSAALLEVLDPEQNNSFSDHYLDVPYDLSKIMFIATANQLDPIPPPLRDRMEVIELPGYTFDEKVHIARNHLIPKQVREHGLSIENIEIADGALAKLIGGYTREAGVRTLERTIADVCRAVAVDVAKGSSAKRTIEAEDLEIILGPEKHYPAGAIPKDGPSAGVTIFTALTSLLTGVRVRGDVAMTGEATLRGLVLPVGGIKEKVLAAHRAGIKRIILPERNKKDLIDVPE